jgi:hypothetical protein
VAIAKIWVFVGSRANTRDRWHWRELLADGTIVRCSEEFSDYGKTVHSAIRDGFDPARENWLIKAGDFTTFYGPASRASGNPARRRPSSATPCAR